MGGMRAAAGLAVAAVLMARWAVPVAPQLDHLVVAIRSLDEEVRKFRVKG